MQERAKRLNELSGLTYFLFNDGLQYDPATLVPKETELSDALRGLQQSLEVLASLPEFVVEPMEPAMRALAEQLGQKPGQLFTTVRVAVTGVTVSPPLFQTMVVLGRARVLKRLQSAIEVLKSAA